MKHRKARPVEFTPEEREREHKMLQGFIDAYNKYPVSVEADLPFVIEQLVSQANALDDSEQSSETPIPPQTDDLLQNLDIYNGLDN